MARKNYRPTQDVEVWSAQPGTQPDLTKLYGEHSPAEDRGSKRTPWHPATVSWWNSLTAHPSFQGLTQAQWFDLAQLAILHDAVNKGALKHRAELRQGLAGYLVTPNDLRRAKIELDTSPTPKLTGNISPSFAKYLEERSIEL